MFRKKKEKKCTPASILKIGLACTPLAIKPDVFSGTSCVLEISKTTIDCWEKFKPKSKPIMRNEFIRPYDFGYSKRFEIPHRIPKEHFYLNNIPRIRKDLDLLNKRLEKEKRIKAKVNKLTIEVKCNNCDTTQLIELNFISKGRKEFICKNCGCKSYFVI